MLDKRDPIVRFGLAHRVASSCALWYGLPPYSAL